MPAIASFFIRQLIIIGVQLGIFSLAEKILVPILNRAIVAVSSFFGVNEEEATDILANEYLEMAEALGITVALSKARIPLKIAERLGFTSKGFSLRKLKGNTEAAVKKAKGVGADTITAKAEILEATTQVTAATQGILSQKAKDVMTIIGFGVGLPTGVMYTIAQYVDYGAWEGSAYQNTFQKLLSVFGIDPDKKITSSKVLTTEMWKRVKSSMEEVGVIALNDPYKNQTVMFSVKSLQDLVDKIAANIAIEEGNPSYKNIMGALSALVVRSKKQVAPIISSFIPAVVAKTTVPQVRVFTGIISQGVLSNTPEFTERPDDIIESYDELKQAAQNNLAIFAQTVLGKISYELKIVSSITTKDGFKQSGTSQQLVRGFRKDGSPLFRTVINKFATLNVFVFTDRKVRTKISTIVLGPVDSVKLQIRFNVIKELEKIIQNETFVNNVSEITGITTSQPITIVPPAARPETERPAPVPPPAAKLRIEITKEYFKNDQMFTFAVLKIKDNKLYIWDNVLDVLTKEERNKYPNFGEQASAARRKLIEMNFNYDAIRTESSLSDVWQKYPTRWPLTFQEFFMPTEEPARATISPTETTRNLNISTLWEWYMMQGLALPSVEERSKIYEQKGLGKAAYYTGTAEQNTKLLKTLM